MSGRSQGSVTKANRDFAGNPAGTANNGLSVDPVTHKIVMGNNPGETGDPGQIFTDRDILMNAILQLLNPSGLPVMVTVDPNQPSIRLALPNGPSLNLDGFTFGTQISWGSGGLSLTQAGGGGEIRIVSPVQNRTGTGAVLLRNAAGGANDGYVQALQGASGNFTTVDLKTVTVVDGVITSIV